MPKPTPIPADNKIIGSNSPLLWIDISPENLKRIASGVNLAIRQGAPTISEINIGKIAGVNSSFKTNLLQLTDTKSIEDAVKVMRGNSSLRDEAISMGQLVEEISDQFTPIRTPIDQVFDNKDAVRIFADNYRLLRNALIQAGSVFTAESDAILQNLMVDNLFDSGHPRGDWFAVSLDQVEGFTIFGDSGLDSLAFNELGVIEKIIDEFPKQPFTGSRMNAILNGLAKADGGITLEQSRAAISKDPSAAGLLAGINNNLMPILVGAINEDNRDNNVNLDIAIRVDVDRFTPEQAISGESPYSFALGEAASAEARQEDIQERSQSDLDLAFASPKELFRNELLKKHLTVEDQNLTKEAKVDYKAALARLENDFVRDVNVIKESKDATNPEISNKILDLVPGINAEAVDAGQLIISGEREGREESESLQSLDSAEKAVRQIISEARLNPKGFTDARITTLANEALQQGNLDVVRQNIQDSSERFILEGQSEEFASLAPAKRQEEIRQRLNLTPAINEAQANAQQGLIERTERRILRDIQFDGVVDLDDFGERRFQRAALPVAREPLPDVRRFTARPSVAAPGAFEPPDRKVEAFESGLRGFRAGQRRDVLGDLPFNVPGSESEALQFGADIPTVQKELSRLTEGVAGPLGGFVTAKFDDEGNFVGPGFARFSSTPGGPLEGMTGPQTKFAARSTGQAARRRARRAEDRAKLAQIAEDEEQERLATSPAATRRRLRGGGSAITGVIGRG